eukprot:CAMPEP_0171292962 /NCGR_PEP_ID=MMETSP0816-20121228/991_1 /TAXON_ID=420281 /ORGANISM="Proboscia inermis, Strain CCAP1064/1" /LENGTH=38 /DNA_ID= /DNA_START= /DNA_END= /DNA_ORIENTATION=
MSAMVVTIFLPVALANRRRSLRLHRSTQSTPASTKYSM